MKLFPGLIICLVCLQLAAVPALAQEDSDWWYTSYENQAAVGGGNVVSSSSATLPVAGSTETTIIIALLGAGLIVAGINQLKFTLAPKV